MKKTELLQLLELPDAFEGFTPDKSSVLWGWNGELPVFDMLIRELRPLLIIEVGSWLGQSASTMAKSLAQNGLNESSILAIDTWLGSEEHWANPEHRAQLRLENGLPTLYPRFLSNMLNSGTSDKIIPLPMTSLIASRYLKSKNIQAQLIYIDGSHDKKDVYDDMEAYFELLSPGGVMFGDDYTVFDSVAAAVAKFSSDKGLAYDTYGVNWRIVKR